MASAVSMEDTAIPEVAPARIDVGDSEAIRASLEENGYACVREAVSADELAHARDLLWHFLEGHETPRMVQTRPVGWKRGQPTTWVEGHGDALMTSTTHNECMWYVRSRPRVLAGFAAACKHPTHVSHHSTHSAQPSESRQHRCPCPRRRRPGRRACGRLRSHVD